MYRTKLKFIPIFIILLVSISNNQCTAFDKEVNCTALFSVHIINKSEDTLGVRFVNYHPKNDMKVSFGKDTCIMMPHTFFVDTIKYNWTSINQCVFEEAQFYNIFAYVYNDNLPEHSTKKELVPWDTTKSKSLLFCGDCTNTYNDTLILP